VVLADAKAGVATGLAAGLFVAYREITKGWHYVGLVDLLSSAKGLLQVPIVVGLLLCVLHAYIARGARSPTMRSSQDTRGRRLGQSCARAIISRRQRRR